MFPFAQLPSLTSVTLSALTLNGSSIPANISQCTQLRVLNLTSNGLTGRLPSFRALTALHTVWLVDRFIGQLPEGVNETETLRVLHVRLFPPLSDDSVTSVFLSYVTVHIDAALFGRLEYLHVHVDGRMDMSAVTNVSCPQLRHLELRGIQAHGVVPLLTNAPRLTHLRLAGDGLLGPLFPSGVSSFAATLRVLHLVALSLRGTIPDHIASLPALELLRLDGAFEGPLPPVGASQTALRSLSISGYDITGTIPDSIASARLLEELSVSARHLRGHVPLYMPALTRLKALRLSSERLTGTFPSWNVLGAAHPALESVRLESPFLGGTIPTPLFHHARLRELLVFQCRVTGTLPASALAPLEFLGLSRNRLEGTLPHWLFGGRMRKIRLEGNRFTGSVPAVTSAALESVRLDDNGLSGTVPSSLFTAGRLVEVSASNNRLVGSLAFPLTPSPLRTLSLANNSLSGTIPSAMGLMTHLEALDLTSNELSGEVPDVFGGMALDSVFLAHNRFVGALPRVSAKVLHVSSNLFSGALPDLSGTPMIEFMASHNRLTDVAGVASRCDHLRLLGLRGNAVTGAVPVLNLTTLVSVDFRDNAFTSAGAFLASSTLTVLRYADFSSNSITGTINLSVLSRFPVLSHLWFAGNRLDTLQQTSASPLTALKSLDVSYNTALRGTLSAALQGTLQHLNASHTALRYEPSPGMRELRLAGAPTWGGGGVMSAFATIIPSLESLDVSDRPLGILNLSAVSPALRKLRVSNCSIETIITNASRPSPLLLSHLDLSFNPLSINASENQRFALARVLDTVPRLVSINLSHCDMMHLKRLAGGPWARLEEMDVSYIRAERMYDAFVMNVTDEASLYRVFRVCMTYAVATVSSSQPFLLPTLFMTVDTTPAFPSLKKLHARGVYTVGQDGGRARTTLVYVMLNLLEHRTDKIRDLHPDCAGLMDQFSDLFHGDLSIAAYLGLWSDIFNRPESLSSEVQFLMSQPSPMLVGRTLMDDFVAESADLLLFTNISTHVLEMPLEYLDVSDCLLEGDLLSPGLPALLTIRELHASNNMISGVDWDSVALAPRLETLDVSHNVELVGAVPTLSSQCNRFTSLKHLHLRNVSLVVDVDTFEIAMPRLVTLDMSRITFYSSSAREELFTTASLPSDHSSEVAASPQTAVQLPPTPRSGGGGGGGGGTSSSSAPPRVHLPPRVFHNVEALTTLNLSQCDTIGGMFPATVWCCGAAISAGVSCSLTDCLSSLRVLALDGTAIDSINFYPVQSFSIAVMDALTVPVDSWRCDASVSLTAKTTTASCDALIPSGLPTLRTLCGIMRHGALTAPASPAVSAGAPPPLSCTPNARMCAVSGLCSHTPCDGVPMGVCENLVGAPDIPCWDPLANVLRARAVSGAVLPLNLTACDGVDTSSLWLVPSGWSAAAAGLRDFDALCAAPVPWTSVATGTATSAIDLSVSGEKGAVDSSSSAAAAAANAPLLLSPDARGSGDPTSGGVPVPQLSAESLLRIGPYMQFVPRAGAAVAVCAAVTSRTAVADDSDSSVDDGFDGDRRSPTPPTIMYSGTAIAVLHIMSGAPRYAELRLATDESTARFTSPLLMRFLDSHRSAVLYTGVVTLSICASPCVAAVRTAPSSVDAGSTALFYLSDATPVPPLAPMLITLTEEGASSSGDGAGGGLAGGGSAPASGGTTVRTRSSASAATGGGGGRYSGLKLALSRLSTVSQVTDPAAAATVPPNALLVVSPLCAPATSWYATDTAKCAAKCPLPGGDGCEPPASACPDGFVCNGTDTICVQPGRWRAGSPCVEMNMTVAPTLTADVCIVNRRGMSPCLGARGCAEGYQGTLCGECSAGYVYSASLQCVECLSTAASWAVLAAMVLGGVAWVVALTVTQMYASTDVDVPCRDESEDLSATSGTLSVYLKLALAAVQMSVALDRLDVDWPGPIRAMREGIGTVLALADMIWLRCVIPALQPFRVRFFVLFAVFSSGLILQEAVLVAWYHRKKVGRVPFAVRLDPRPSIRARLRASVVRPVFPLVLLTIAVYALYQPLTNTVTLSFIDVSVASVPPGNESFLLADLAMSTSGTAAKTMRGLAASAVVVSMLGYPIAMAFFLLLLKPWLRTCSGTRALMGLFLVGYREGAEWFELFRITRAAFTTMAAAARMGGFQVTAVLLLLLCELCVTAYVRPYVSNHAHRLQMFTLSVGVVQLVFAITLISSAIAGETVINTTFAERALADIAPIILVALDIVTIAMFVSEIWGEVWRVDTCRRCVLKFRVARALHTFVCRVSGALSGAVRRVKSCVTRSVHGDHAVTTPACSGKKPSGGCSTGPCGGDGGACLCSGSGTSPDTPSRMCEQHDDVLRARDSDLSRLRASVLTLRQRHDAAAGAVTRLLVGHQQHHAASSSAATAAAVPPHAAQRSNADGDVGDTRRRDVV